MRHCCLSVSLSVCWIGSYYRDGVQQPAGAADDSNDRLALAEQVLNDVKMDTGALREAALRPHQSWVAERATWCKRILAKL
jgi:hypothetical protein